LRILLLTQWFEPEPALKGLLFARALEAKGHEVEVLTGFPNYPGGRVYPGYRIKPFRREVIDGIRVIRVALFPSHDASPMRRILNYVSFAASAVVFGSLLTRRADVIYAYHPPLTVGVAASMLGFVKRAPFVYDIQDLWPDTLAATGMMGARLPLKVVDKVARWVYRRAAHVVAQSPGFAARLAERGVPTRKLSVIYNWSHEREASVEGNARIAAELKAGGRFNVVFAGTMGRAQGLGAVLQAAKLLDRPGSRIRFAFVGGGIEADALKAEAEGLGLHNVRFFSRVPMSEIGAVLAAADVLLVHLTDDPLFEITIPAKTQAYLSSGKPILIGVRGDAADLVAKSGGGVSCEPEDPQSIAEEVTRLEAMDPSELQAMGARGEAFYRSELSLEIGTLRFLQIFDQVVSDPQDASGPDGDPGSILGNSEPQG
jgi:colanic acid biosynthesis glycosyl transferase WcaI